MTTEIQTSDSLREVRYEIRGQLAQRAHEMERQGIDIVHLEVGEPDFDAPPCVKEALCKALEDGTTHYTHSLGRVDLREAICDHYASRYGVDAHPDQVVQGVGHLSDPYRVLAVGDIGDRV